MLLDVKVGAYDPCSLAVLMGRLHGCRSGHSCWRAVFTGSEDRRPRTRPVLTAVLKKSIVMQFLPTWPVDTGTLSTLPVFTGRVDGPSIRHVNTGVILDKVLHVPCSRATLFTPANTGRHGYCGQTLVNTGVQTGTHVDGPCWRPVNTSTVYRPKCDRSDYFQTNSTSQ